jgi:hypothetical protein
LRKYGNTSSETYTPDREISIPARSVVTVVYELSRTQTALATLENELIDIKYYTLQGIEILNNKANGVYIVKKRYKSGKAVTDKVLINNNR